MAKLKPHPFADLLPPMTDAEYGELRESIRVNGLREVITLHRDGRILDGRHRDRACGETGREPRYRTFKGTDSAALAFVLDLNVKRRHLNESQRAAIAAEIANMPHGGDRRSDQAATLPLVSQAAAAIALNVSERTVRDAVAVRNRAPALFAVVKAGKIPVSQAALIAKMSPERHADVVRRIQDGENVPWVVNSESRIERAAQIEAEARLVSLNSLGRTFSVQYGDPPWRHPRSVLGGRATELHYPTMTLDDICALPVADFAAKNAVLYLWAALLPEAQKVAEAWGFEYTSNAVWVKPSIGMGDWFRSQHELIICAKRGHMPPPPFPRSSVFTGPPAVPSDHSSKPNEVRDWIASAYPGAGRIELFARTAAPGWTTWGNQAPDLAAD